MDPTRRGRQSGMRGLPGARGDRPAGALEPLLSSRFAPPRRGNPPGTDRNWQVVASWRVSPARARNASGQGVSLSVLGAVRAAELRSGSMGSILSNRTDSGCVTRSNPISASRTASRFGFCQAFCDPLGPVLTFNFLNNYGVFWEFCIGGIGSGGRRSVKPSCRRAKARFVSSLTLKEGDVRSMSGRYTDAAAAKGATPS